MFWTNFIYMINCINIWVIWVPRILSFVYLSVAFAFKMILYIPFLQLCQNTGRNSYGSCVAMSYHIQNTFYCCQFLFWFIFMIFFAIFTRVFFVSDKDVPGFFLPLTLLVYLMIRLLLQLLLSIVNLNHLLKILFKDGLNDNN